MKLLLLIFGASLALLGQAPQRLSTLQRIQVPNLERVQKDRQRLARQRHPIASDGAWRDVRAILHCHAEDATHTGGTRPEVLAAAKKTGVSAVLLSDHVRPQRDYIDDSWRGLREGVLFIPGSEAEGFLNYPMRSIRGLKWTSPQEYIALIRRNGGLIFLSHVEERLDFSTDQLDGLEIYNRHTDYNDETEFRQWFRRALGDPASWAELARILEQYPEEFFGAQQDYLASIVAMWDRGSQRHPLTGVAANDSHHNQIFTLTRIDAQSAAIDSFERKGLGTIRASDKPALADLLKDRRDGEVLYRLDFDPYEISFRDVSTHLLVKSLTEAEVREALRAGRAYVAHDWLCDPAGFVFQAVDGERRFSMGARVADSPGLRLAAASPARAQFRLLHNGKPIFEQTADRLSWQVEAPGVYRLELWLEVGGEL